MHSLSVCGAPSAAKSVLSLHFVFCRREHHQLVCSWFWCSRPHIPSDLLVECKRAWPRGSPLQQALPHVLFVVWLDTPLGNAGRPRCVHDVHDLRRAPAGRGTLDQLGHGLPVRRLEALPREGIGAARVGGGEAGSYDCAAQSGTEGRRVAMCVRCDKDSVREWV
jgi:hypothetical protein